MKKKLTILLSMLLTAVMALGACGSAPGANASASASASPSPSATEEGVAVAQMDGKPIYMPEFKAWLDQNIQGGSAVLEEESYAKELPDLLDSFLSYKIIQVELKNRGYLDKLTSDQVEQAKQSVQDELDYAVSNYGVTEEQYLAQTGVTKDQLIEQYKFYTAANAAYSDPALVGDTTPKEEDIKKKYDESVANDQKTMDADPTQYVTNSSDGATVYYVPAGVRMVRNVLVGFDEDTTGAIQTLRKEGYTKQADQIRDTALAGLKAEADDLANKIKSGKLSFTDAVAQSDDKGMPAEGYPVVTGTKQYADTFTQASMALTAIGQVSDLFATDYGYHIVEYTSDLPQGPVAYESVKDTISADLQTSLQSDAWNALLEQWKKDHNIVQNTDVL